MPSFEDHPDPPIRCALCGYTFRKNDRYAYHRPDANDLPEGLVCENEKGCRRRQRTPKPEYANPDATADEMLDKIAGELSANVERIMLQASEDEDWLRYLYRACYSSGPLVRACW